MMTAQVIPFEKTVPKSRRKATTFWESGNRPTVTVIIPAMNEEKNLPHILPLIPDWIDEILLVDGHSKDNTVGVAKELCPNIRIVMQEGKGKGAALRTGFAKAKGDIIVTMDADGSMDPREIPTFVGALLAGADFVKGSRFVQGAGTTDMPFYRKVGNAALTTLSNVLFGTRFTDITYGFQACWRYCTPALSLEIDGWAHEIINLLRASRHGLRISEVACFEHSRIAGTAKLKAFPAGWAILKAIVKERFSRRSSWKVWDHRLIVGDTTFSPSIQLLRKETLQLIASSPDLSEESYKQAVETIEQAFNTINELDSQLPDVSKLQQQYRSRFTSREFNAFLKHVS